MRDYKDLLVWKKAHELVLNIYKSTKDFPSEEKFNLVSQVRRAGTSVPTNIAEGCGKYTQADFARYLQNALGSVQEVEYLLFLSYELSFLKEENYKQLDTQANEVKAMTISLIKKVRGDTNG